MNKPHKEPQMMKVLHALTTEDAAICCYHLIQRSGEQYAHIHRGLLPFVEIKTVLWALNAVDTKRPLAEAGPSRRVKQVVAKISEAAPSWGPDWPLVAPRTLALDDKLVLKHFGPNPHLGRPFHWLSKQRVTVGIRWSLPKKQYVPDDDVLVSPCVALQKAGNGLWHVNCDPKHHAAVTIWLVDNLRAPTRR